MALVSKSIPNLINGVSQQPAALRLDSQLELQENAFSDVVDGLKKRPPTKIIQKLKCVDPASVMSGSALSSNQNTKAYAWATEDVPNLDKAFFHTYKRSDDEIYLVVITQTDGSHVENAPNNVNFHTRKVLVYDQNCNLRFESQVASWDANGDWIAWDASSTGYLPDYSVSGVATLQNINFNNDLTATTVADATFIVNKKKTITDASSSSSSSPSNVIYSHPRTALIYLKSVNYGREYTVQCIGDDNPNALRLSQSSATTPKQITATTTNSQTINNDGLKTSTVVNSLRSLSTSGGGSMALRPSGHNEEPYFIVEASSGFGDFKLKVTDDDGGVNLKGFKDNAKSFTDLPNQCEDGFVLGVVGDNQKKEDDFYVKFEGAGGSGFWRECAVPNTENGIERDTMPHQLKQNADLSFTFGHADWATRKCGDENTNPFPSFVGSNISDVFFHRNRLGFLSGENVIFSGAGDYYNFFRTTVRSLLDSDPIDVAVSQNEVSELRAAVPIQDNLLLFSSLNQFTLSASQLLTPAEVTVEQSTKYECDLNPSPIAAGNSVFFATTSGGYAGVREFFTRETTEVKDASSITSHVPTYIAGKITQFTASANEDMLVARVTGDTEAQKTLYVYKWYNSATERLQSSWSKWTFSKPIAHIFFSNNILYMTHTDGDCVTMDMQYDETEVLLDNQYNIGAYNPLTDAQVVKANQGGAFPYYVYVPRTTELVGYDLDGYQAVNGTGELIPFEWGTHYASYSSVQRAALDDNALYVGTPYTFKAQMSEQLFKPTQGDSTRLSRFQLRKMSFNFSKSGHFDVQVSSVGKSPITSHFTGRVLDNQHNLLDQAAIIDDGAFEVGVQAQASQTDITITNDSHLPSTFQSAEWEGYIVLRNQRL
jgi:hypothetical protein